MLSRKAEAAGMKPLPPLFPALLCVKMADQRRTGTRPDGEFTGQMRCEPRVQNLQHRTKSQNGYGEVDGNQEI